jgi:rhamnulokinase
MPSDHYVAFDLGAESGRVVLGALDGDRLKIEEKHRFATPVGRMNGALHWNLLGLWEEMKLGLRKCAVDRGQKRDIEAVGVDAWGVDFGLIAPNGDVLANPVHYRDRRTDGVMEKVFQRVSRQHVFDVTGVQFLPFNTIYQLVAMQQARSSLLSAAETLLFIPDLLNYLFTGKRQTEFSIATTSQLYNPRKLAWADELMRELELPRNLLPNTVAPSGSTVGPMRKEVAAECRVGPIPVIAPGSHDTASAVAVVPANGGDWCFISSGTWSLMGVELNSPLITEKALRYEFTNEGGVGGRFRFLKNITGLWLVQEVRRAFAAEGRNYSYDELVAMAVQAEPFRCVIDPDHRPFTQPGDIPKKIDRFAAATQQRPPATPGEFVRTCLESLAIKYRQTLDALEDATGRRIKAIHVVGGGSRNDLLNQMTADACNRNVLAGPAEAAAIGNVLVQSMAMGRVRNLEQARSIVRSSFEIKRFEPRDNKAWEGALNRYRDLRQVQS